MKASSFKKIAGIMYSLAAAMALSRIGGFILYNELFGGLSLLAISMLFAHNAFLKTTAFLRWLKLERAIGSQKGIVLRF